MFFVSKIGYRSLFLRYVSRLCLPFAFSAIASAAKGENTITFASPDFWCPYTCDVNKDNHEGFQIDIARLVIGHLGKKVKYFPTNYERAIQSVRVGRIDALPSALPGEAKGFIYSTTPQMEQLWCFYAPKGGTWKYNSYTDLEKLQGTIGTVKGYSFGKKYDEFFQTNKQKADVFFGDDVLNRMVSKIESKRGMVAFLEDRTLIDYLQVNKKMKPLENLGCLADVKAETYVAFSPTKKEFVEFAAKYSEVLKKLREEGKLESIYRKYGLTDPFKTK
jgi:polar amino acid transport system substrate-binding protein